MPLVSKKMSVAPAFLRKVVLGNVTALTCPPANAMEMDYLPVVRSIDNILTNIDHTL